MITLASHTILLTILAGHTILVDYPSWPYCTGSFPWPIVLFWLILAGRTIPAHWSSWPSCFGCLPIMTVLFSKAISGIKISLSLENVQMVLTPPPVFLISSKKLFKNHILDFFRWWLPSVVTLDGRTIPSGCPCWHYCSDSLSWLYCFGWLPYKAMLIWLIVLADLTVLASCPY